MINKGVFTVLLLTPVITGAGKILLLPAPLYSHCLEVSAVGGQLAAKGHQVKIFFGSNFDHKNCFVRGNEGREGIEPIIYKSKEGLVTPAEMILENSHLMEDGEFDIMKNVKKVFEFIRIISENILCDKNAIMDLKKENFDLAVVDGFYLSYSLYAIPHSLQIPYVSVSTHYDDFVSGRPTLFSIVPSSLSKFTDNMSFWHKLTNIAYYIMYHLMSRLSIPTDQIEEYIPGVTAKDMLNIVSKSELFIFNHDIILDYPVPVMPNHILAGGLATQPAKPLKGEFKEIYSMSSTDIIVVTFGSTFSKLPDKVEEKLIRAFKILNVKVIWKYFNRGKDGNIVKMSWLPQNDLLANQKTKLFISHCGNNGLFEAIYNSVPILCTPFFGDQFAKAIRVEHWNVGRYINIITSSEEQLVEVISDALNNPLYKENMKNISAIFHSRPFTPRQRAALGVEHILKFGGDHLHSEGTNMSVISFLGYDLLLFILGVKFVIVFVVYRCVVFGYRRFCNGRQRKLKTT